MVNDSAEGRDIFSKFQGLLEVDAFQAIPLFFRCQTRTMEKEARVGHEEREGIFLLSHVQCNNEN